MFKNLIDRFTAPNPDNVSPGYIYKRLGHYFRPYLPRVIITALITIPIGAFDAAIAYSMKPFVDTLHQGKSVVAVAYIPYIIVAFTVLQGLLNYLSIYLNGWLGARIMADIRQDLFIKLQTMHIGFFDKNHTSRVIRAYFQEPQSINANILNNSKQMLTRIFSSLFLMGVLVMISWKLSIIAIGILLLILLPSTQIRKIIKKLVHATEDANSHVLAYFTETVGGARVINGYNIARNREKEFKKAQKQLTDMAIKATQVRGWLTPSMHIIAAVGIAVIVWQGSKMAVTGELTNGEFASFMVSMLMLYNPIKNLGSSIMTAQMSLIAADRIFRRLDLLPEVADKPDAKPLPEIMDKIEFRDVSFAYEPEKFVLKDVNIVFPKGKMAALVGASGGGKSTIANLIPRFYDVQQGAILVDGVDVRDVTMASLRQKIAIVNQENFLFSASIRENLLVGNAKASEPQLYEALKKAYLLDLVNSLPEGLDTQIGERGALLSGGQRQRLAIARAFLKDAPVVILDEATSALDNESEAIVLKAMESLMANRTVIVIAHRLSTIRNADKVVVIDSGRVVEEGTHDQLLAADGYYTRLYNTQFTPDANGQRDKIFLTTPIIQG